MGKNLIGLDIGSYSIKVIQLKGSGNKWSLAKYAYRKISAGSTAELSPDERKDIIILPYISSESRERSETITHK